MHNHLSFYQTTAHVVGTQKNPLTEITFFKEAIYSGTSILSFYIISNDESFESLSVLFIDQNP